nr:uncharacterized protein C12orf71 homolog isoform X1 [Meriones unguiculatus]
MTASSSSSDYSSADDSASEYGSKHSLSVGHYPSENTFSYEDVAPCKETASRDAEVHFLPLSQGAWGTESLRRLLKKREKMEHAPDQFCKLSITLAWDFDVDSDQEDSPANLDLNRHSQWMDKWPEDSTKLTLCKLDNLVQNLETFLEKGGQHDGCVLPESTQKEDLHLTSGACSHTAQVSHKDLPRYKARENEAICQALESPPRLQKEEVGQEIQQADESSLDSSTSSAQAEEASHSHYTSCLNFRWVLHWLRTQVFSRWRRKHVRQAAISWHQKAARKINSLRGNRIQPQE